MNYIETITRTCLIYSFALFFKEAELTVSDSKIRLLSVQLLVVGHRVSEPNLELS